MDCHGDRRPGRYTSTGAKDTRSDTMKPANEFHVTLDEEQGEVTSADEGHDVERVEFGVRNVVAGGEDVQ